MIKTSDIPSLTPSPSTTSLDAIEAHIDMAILRHVESGHEWPLVIPTTRSGWDKRDIEIVLARYRSTGGWSAMLGVVRGAMCVLSPSTPATANPDDGSLGPVVIPDPS